MPTPQESFINTLTSSWLNTYPLCLYSILTGVSIFLLIWLDKLLDINLRMLYINGVSSSTVAFIIGSVFVLTPLIKMLCDSIWIYFKIACLRIKYPQKQLDKRFVLIHFNGRVFLVDTQEKIMRWIQTWQTALDLNFIDKWTDSKITLKEPGILVGNEIVTTKEGIELPLKDYHLGRPILTRNTPNN